MQSCIRAVTYSWACAHAVLSAWKGFVHLANPYSSFSTQLSSRVKASVTPHHDLPFLDTTHILTSDCNCLHVRISSASLHSVIQGVVIYSFTASQVHRWTKQVKITGLLKCMPFLDFENSTRRYQFKCRRDTISYGAKLMSSNMLLLYLLLLLLEPKSILHSQETSNQLKKTHSSLV